jgi:hypothetical protein
VTEPVRADVEVREPRCRICRDETVRVVVNQLLDLRGAPAIVWVAIRGRQIAYTDIRGMLEPTLPRWGVACPRRGYLYRIGSSRWAG